MSKNQLRNEYVNIMTKLKHEWQLFNQCPFGNAFIPDQLNGYILQRAPLIKRLGELHRELGLDE
jgi:hypothetical protein